VASPVPCLAETTQHSCQTQGGDLNNNTTRFWLALSPDDAVQLLVSYLTAELGDDNVRYDQRQHSAHILVQKMAGNKSVSGTFVVRGNDSLSQNGQTLVVMKRGKVCCAAENRETGLMKGIDSALAGVLVVYCPGSANRTVCRQGGLSWIGYCVTSSPTRLPLAITTRRLPLVCCALSTVGRRLGTMGQPRKTDRTWDEWLRRML
jgi:hypothetical protein